MTCKRAHHSGTLRVFGLFVAVLTVWVSFATPGAVASTPPSFLPASTYYWNGGVPTSVTLLDLDGDGRPDLLVSGNGTVGVLLRKGNDTFQEPSAYYDTGGQAVSPAVVADLNGDGKPDLVVAESCAGWVGNCVWRDPGWRPVGQWRWHFPTGCSLQNRRVFSGFLGWQ
jgi:hypothetical protein